jgi:acyl carrier protein
MDIELILKQVIANILKIDPVIIQSGSGMGKTEGWDSMKALGIVLEIEKTLSISFDIDEYEHLTSYDSILLTVKKYLPP